MKHTFNVKEYSKIREEAKQHFLNKKTGDQDLFTEQSKLYKPIIQSTKELEKSLKSGQHELIVGQQELIKQTALEQARSLPQLEFHTPEGPRGIKSMKTIDLDGVLVTDAHIENLQEMNLELPSEVYERDIIDITLKKITAMNRSLGQYLGVNSKKTEQEKEMYRSQKETLQLYEKKINALDKSRQFEVKEGQGLKAKKLVKLKRGRGRPRKNPDVIHYKSSENLIEKLREYCAGKEAGNTGLDNYIVSILDELLETKTISKDEYSKIFSNIFNV
jgi:hypothetical protein